MRSPPGRLDLDTWSTGHAFVEVLNTCAATSAQISDLQSDAMLFHFDPPSSSSHSMRSVERTPGFLDLVKSERLAILLNTPV